MLVVFGRCEQCGHSMLRTPRLIRAWSCLHASAIFVQIPSFQLIELFKLHDMLLCVSPLTILNIIENNPKRVLSNKELFLSLLWRNFQMVFIHLYLSWVNIYRVYLSSHCIWAPIWDVHSRKANGNMMYLKVCLGIRHYLYPSIIDRQEFGGYP
jgi:hypothetical protein